MATFQNQAKLSYKGITTLSNTVSGELQEALAIEKTSLPTTYSYEDTITYTISVTNNGTGSITGITISDNLGAYTFGTEDPQTLTPLTYEAGTATAYMNGKKYTGTLVITPGPPLTIRNFTLAPGDNLMVIYQVTVNSFAPLAVGSTITNTATVSGGDLSTPVTAATTITTAQTPILNIEKLIDPTTVSENSPITYTFNILNSGNTPASATDNVIVTDTFLPKISINSVTLNGQPQVYQYDTDGNFSTQIATVNSATFQQDAETGEYTITPGVATLVINGTI